ncbi:MAG: hypothetical protein ACRC92_26005 [Peptostreptococcaceae bacterium]
MAVMVFSGKAGQVLDLAGDKLYFTGEVNEIGADFKSAQNLQLGLWHDMDKLTFVTDTSTGSAWLYPSYNDMLYLDNDKRRLVRPIPDEFKLDNWSPCSYSMDDWQSSQRNEESKIQIPGVSYQILASDNHITALAKKLMARPIFVTPESHSETNKMVNGIKKSINTNSVSHAQCTKLAELFNFRMDIVVTDPLKKKDVYRAFQTSSGPVIMVSKTGQEIDNSIVQSVTPVAPITPRV